MKKVTNNQNTEPDISQEQKIKEIFPNKKSKLLIFTTLFLILFFGTLLIIFFNRNYESNKNTDKENFSETTSQISNNKSKEEMPETVNDINYQPSDENLAKYDAFSELIEITKDTSTEWNVYNSKYGFSFKYPKGYKIIVSEESKNRLEVGIYKDQKTIDEINRCNSSESTKKTLQMGWGYDCLKSAVLSPSDINKDKNFLPPSKGDGFVIEINRNFNNYVYDTTSYDTGTMITEWHYNSGESKGLTAIFLNRVVNFTKDENISFNDDPQKNNLYKSELIIHESEISNITVTLTSNEKNRDSILASIKADLYPYYLEEIFLDKDLKSDGTEVKSENSLWSYKYPEVLYPSERPDYGDVYYFFTKNDQINWENTKESIDKDETPHGTSPREKNIMVRFEETIPEVSNKFQPYFGNLLGKKITLNDTKLFITVIGDETTTDTQRVLVYGQDDKGFMTFEFSVFYLPEDLDIVRGMVSSLSKVNQ